MSRDYATTPKKKSRKNNQKQASPVKWLFAGLLLGVGIAVLAYIQLAGDKLPEVDLAIPEILKKDDTKKKQKQFPAVEEQKESEYEFWDLLKNKTVVVPEDESSKNISDQPARKFIMQCGSFRKRDMAETLRAQIAMAGFESFIKTTSEEDNNNWHRVVLGPYEAKRQAESIRHRLRENQIMGCQIW